MTHLTQGTAEWLAYRREKIGASDAAIIMGVSPFKTRHALWLEKLGMKQPFKTAAMQAGLDCEDAARDAFERLTGCCVFPEVVEHTYHTWMIASLDGIDMGRRFVLEIKKAGKRDHDTAKSGKVPTHYYPQLQHQLAVTGLPMAYYFSYTGTDNVLIECYRDDAYIETLISKEKEFYDCVVNFIEPERVETGVERNDEIWNSLTDELLNIQVKMRAYDELIKREEVIREQLISMCANQDGYGNGVAVKRVERKGNVDYSKIPELSNVDLDLYRKDKIISWKISFS